MEIRVVIFPINCTKIITDETCSNFRKQCICRERQILKKKVLALVLLLLLLMTIISWSGCRSSNNKDDIYSFDDLETARIGVMTGATAEQLAPKFFPKADVKSFDDTMEAVAALLSGQVDAILTGYPTAFNLTKYNSSLRYLPEALVNEDTSVAVKKGNDELLKAVDKVITDLKEDGTLKEMTDRWFKTDSTPYEIIDLPVPTEGEVLKIGVNATREPVSFLDASGNVTGIDAELAYRISIALNRPVEFMDMKFSALIPALQAGKVDLIVTGMSATDERRLSVNFTQSYFANSQVFTVRNSDGGKGLGMSALKDISDKRIGVLSGSIYEKYIKDNFPDAKILLYDSTSDMILALKSLKIDATLFDMFSANLVLKNNSDLAIITKDALDSPLGVGFSKQNPQLRERFNTFLKEALADGTTSTMRVRWFENDPESAVMPDFDFSGGKEKVVLGVAVEELPYVAYKDNRYVGYDIEMISRFAQKENISLEIVTMDFSALVIALASGKVDMIAAGISITEERSRQVDFSDKYCDSKTAVVALKSNITGFDTSQSDSGSPSFFSEVKNAFYRNIIFERRYLLIFEGLKTTAIIAILSCIFGTLLGALICFMSMSGRKVPNIIARIYISILRGIPAVVLLMLIFYVAFASVNINPIIVATIAFGLNFAAYVSEMFRSAILSVDKGQYEAGIAGGFSKPATFIYIIMPQAARQAMPVYKGEFISMVKMTSVVGYIAVQDLTKAGDIIRSRTFDAFFPLIMIAVLYYLISWLLALFLDYLAYKTDAKAQRDRIKKRQRLREAGEQSKMKGLQG